MTVIGKYIPPHLRGLPPNDDKLLSSLTKTESNSSSQNYTNEDLSRIFNTPHICSLPFFSYPDNFTKKPEIRIHTESGEKKYETIYPPNHHPLKYLINFIVIFHDAHPHWKTQNELWLHTHSKDLIEEYSGGKKNFGRPLPVFSGQGRVGNFEFLGFWTIHLREIVLPHSEELKRMIEIKEGIKDHGHKGRKGTSWVGPLSFTWLKLQLTPVENGKFSLSRRMKKGEAAEYTLESGGLGQELEILNKSTSNEESYK